LPQGKRARKRIARQPLGYFIQAPIEMPPRNPFRKKFWNLTEQMRFQKKDRQFAAKLKAEAWAEWD
jgi:hypothetical protein